MINVYTIENGVYYCQGQYEDYNTKLANRVKDLLKNHSPSNIVICKKGDVIKHQFERAVQ